MRVLVTGDRNWTDQNLVTAVLDGLRAHPSDQLGFMVIEGGARGADTCAQKYVQQTYLVAHQRFPADWKKQGSAAGPIRNQRMLDTGCPNLVVAFHDNLAASKGTADMVRRAKKAGVPVVVISHG